MIIISHPFEDDQPQICAQRREWAQFLTTHIAHYMMPDPVVNFPLTWFGIYAELGIRGREGIEAFLQFAGRADAAIFIGFPGRELCERTKKEKEAIHRLEIPVVEFPFYRHRFEQQCKQNALLADQKRVLNLLRANLKNP